MSSPGQSRGTPKPADLFEDLWRQLGECHQNALQELEAKVIKLKNERCLDAKRLEVFYNRTQQLKEQNKTLQDAISLLEERLHAGECDRCAILEENLKNNQDQNLCLIAKLKNEKKCLEDENRKLHAELQKLKMFRLEPQQASSPEQEEGIIPDSPILPSSLPVTNKLKKRKDGGKMKHVRYAEMPLPQSNKSLFSVLDKEPVDATKNPGRVQVLVPNTCELDASQLSNDVNPYLEEAVAETCGLELIDKPDMKTDTAAGQQSSSRSPWKCVSRLKPYRSTPSSTLLHSPESTTETSPSLLPRVKRFSEDGSVNKAKRKKEETEQEVQEEDKQEIQEGVDKQKEGKHKQPDLIKQASASISNQSFSKQLLDGKAGPALNGTSNQRPDVSCISPAFKKPNVREANKESAGKKGTARLNLNASHDQHEGKDAERKHRVEPSWSIDPALALSMYDSEWREHEQKEDEEECPGELVDTDCTWVSHSLLQCRGENAQDKRHSVSGIGEKANDSLDMMFDTTAYGEYKSFNNSHSGQSQPCGENDDEEREEEDEDDHQEPYEDTMSQSNRQKARRPAFAHVAVVRKKDERRKLKGTTCKECEIYYAHLPEEERQKKLSACSRHRFLYIPPCTPENFWEVGFPSTQTCIERGYIKEEKTPQARTRRRQPLNALFSPNPKKKQQES
ncbi:DNA endonuclease RBBP8 [Plectropomus leopardus]|uniref:DNA endonuclease RBBP8 n=1 Tax=Plectropomus leopardus TaxID=160734 RepID=UPI001C4AB911|nr:DNA endonuclease RBBP8 [Plectropomus leopardus]XP_042366563.1 DNA endonuclease RBBP8 [Plectropomus leopardus]